MTVDYLVGIDLGLGGKGSPTAIAILDGSGARVIKLATLRAVNDDPTMRTLMAGAQVAEILTSVVPSRSNVRCAIEQAPFVQNALTAFRLAVAWGIYAARVYDVLGVVPRAIPPTIAKVNMTGNGRAEKEDMIRMALQRYDVQANEHEADAIGIALSSGGADDRGMG